MGINKVGSSNQSNKSGQFVRVNRKKQGEENLLNEKQRERFERLEEFLRGLDPDLERWLYRSNVYNTKIDVGISVRLDSGMNVVECKSEMSESDLYVVEKSCWTKEEGDKHIKNVPNTKIKYELERSRKCIKDIFKKYSSWLYNTNVQEDHNRIELIIRTGKIVRINYIASHNLVSEV